MRGEERGEAVGVTLLEWRGECEPLLLLFAERRRLHGSVCEDLRRWSKGLVWHETAVSEDLDGEERARR